MCLMGRFRLATAKPATSAIPTPPISTATPQNPGHARTQFNPSSFKRSLMQAKLRAEVEKSRLQNVMHQTRQAAVLALRSSNTPVAFVRAQQLLRESRTDEAFDILAVYFELLSGCIARIEHVRDFSRLDADARAAIASLAFASTRMNNPELKEAVQTLRMYYGAQVIDPMSRCDGPNADLVNSSVVVKLDNATPNDFDVLERLNGIARDEAIPWIPPADPEDAKNGRMQYPLQPIVLTTFASPQSHVHDVYPNGLHPANVTQYAATYTLDVTHGHGISYVTPPGIGQTPTYPNGGAPPYYTGYNPALYPDYRGHGPAPYQKK